MRDLQGPLMMGSFGVFLQFDMTFQLHVVISADVVTVDGERVVSGRQTVNFERFLAKVMTEIRQFCAELGLLGKNPRQTLSLPVEFQAIFAPTEVGQSAACGFDPMSDGARGLLQIWQRNSAPACSESHSTLFCPDNGPIHRGT